MATLNYGDTEPHTATLWTDSDGASWSWNGWGEWVCTLNGSPFCLKAWEKIPRRMFPMTKAG